MHTLKRKLLIKHSKTETGKISKNGFFLLSTTFKIYSHIFVKDFTDNFYKKYFCALHSYVKPVKLLLYKITERA